eukprot:3935474-Prymnesium_polylepis.1
MEVGGGGLAHHARRFEQPDGDAGQCMLGPVEGVAVRERVFVSRVIATSIITPLEISCGCRWRGASTGCTSFQPRVRADGQEWGAAPPQGCEADRDRPDVDAADAHPPAGAVRR